MWEHPYLSSPVNLGPPGTFEFCREMAARKARYDALIEAACIADRFDFDGGLAARIADAIRDHAEAVIAGKANR